MAHIIAGHLQQQEQVQELIDRLIETGFTRDNICTFYLNPAGQHDLYPIGGDQDKSPGAKESDEGLVTGIAAGGVIGAAIGAAGIPIAGPLAPAVGALVGAHLGSLAGSMSSMKEKGESEEDSEGNANIMPQRKSGMMVAVGLPDPAQENKAVQIFRHHGAQQIERADGTITGGDWIDFNPIIPPVLLEPEVKSGA